VPKYPYADLQEFRQRIRTVNPHFERFRKSSLHSLLTVLESNNGTADAVTSALNALPEAEARKYANALRYLRWTYPGLPTYLGTDVRALRDRVIANATDAQIQAELDRLPVALAIKYEQALRRLVKKRRALEYFGLESFTPAYNGSLSVDTSNNSRVGYTTKHFHATARVYAIVPEGVDYDLGFIQICEDRESIHIYEHDELDTRWEMQGRFPKSDSSSDANIPWYHVGVGHACSHHTARKDHEPARRETYELDDNFNNCTIGARLTYKKGGVEKRTHLKAIRRKQSFRAWFAVKRSRGTKYRLLKEVFYGFDFQIDCQTQHGRLATTQTDTPVNIVQTTPAAGATLPPAALTGPTMNGGQKLNVYAKNWRKCDISQEINLA
jgi:hypothetical protein